MMDNIVIIGSTGHAKVVLDIIEKESRYKVVGFIDDFKEIGEKVLGYEVIGKVEALLQLKIKYDIKGGIVAIGDNFIRNRVAVNILKILPDFKFVKAIHPKANIAKEVQIGEGTVIMAGVSVNPCCNIGKFCILNTNSSLDHDSTMEDYSSIAPNVSTGGNVRIQTFSYIGINATVIHGINIGKHTVIGAGSTVLRDVGDYKVAYGSPARVIRSRKEGESYL